MSTRWKPSVTVAAIVARQIDGRTCYLLVEELTPEGLMINNPAGHLDPAESPLQGVVRETLEETTRDFSPEYLVGLYMSRFQRVGRSAGNPGLVDEDVTYLRFAYAGTVGEPDPQRVLDDGIVRTVWMSLDELRACRDRHRSALVLRCIEDHAAGRRYPLDLLCVDDSLYSPEIKLPP